MHFPKYWAVGKSGSFTCWRSSEVSVDDALAKAVEGAKAVEARVKGGDRKWQYGYPGREVREEVLSEGRDASGSLTWAVTRNAYGCEVLNTAGLVFVDVDLGERAPPAAATPHLDKARRWVDAHPAWGLRVYRTAAGLRLVATHAAVSPTDAVVTDDLFPALGADPLYQRLCKVQRSYRARLTPKPWRCGLSAPKQRWPWADASMEKRFRGWQARYDLAAKSFATCELLAELGEKTVAPELAPLIERHDLAARVGSGLPLA